VIVSSSRYWFNYRHSANALAVYAAVRRLGLDDEHIVLLDAGQVLQEDRNARRGHVVTSSTSQGVKEDVGIDIDIDYQGNDVHIDTLRYVLTGRVTHSDNTVPSAPLLPRLHSHGNSSVLLYLAGHGGDEFFKFHDHEELDAQELFEIFAEMHALDRYGRMLVVLDTCQAATMAAPPLTSTLSAAPNIAFLASSRKDENSYAFHHNMDLGVAVIDRYTHLLVDWLSTPPLPPDAPGIPGHRRQQKQQQQQWEAMTVQDMFQALNRPHFLMSRPALLTSTGMSPDRVQAASFFRPPPRWDWRVDPLLPWPTTTTAIPTSLENLRSSPSNVFVQLWDDLETVTADHVATTPVVNHNHHHNNKHTVMSSPYSALNSFLILFLLIVFCSFL
jgi:hypothetical protein